MGSQPDKLTRTIFQYDNLCVRLHIRLYNEKHQPYHTEFEYNDKMYAKIDLFPFVTFEIKDKYNKMKQSIDSSILLTQPGLNQVLTTMNDFIHSIYTENIFAVKKNKEIIIYRDAAIQFSKEIRIVGTNNNLGMTPSVIYDESSQLTYEGAVLYINKRSCETALPITYLEGLYYTLNKIDLFRDSQLLLNYYVSYYNPREYVNEIVKKQNKKTLHPKINFNSDYSEPDPDLKNKIVANFRNPESTSELFYGLGNMSDEEV